MSHRSTFRSCLLTLLEKMFRLPLLPIVTIFALGGSGWAILCALQSYAVSSLLQWAASLSAVGYISGPVGGLIGRIIGTGFGEETLGRVLGLALGLLWGLTVGVLVARCLFEILIATGGWHYQQVWTIAGLAGGIMSGLLVGIVEGWLTVRRATIGRLIQ